MYGKTIVITFGEDIECRLFVFGTPDLSPDEWHRRARQQLMRELRKASAND